MHVKPLILIFHLTACVGLHVPTIAMQRAVMHLACLHVMSHLNNARQEKKQGVVSHHISRSALSVVLTPGIEHFKATGELHSQVSSPVWGAVWRWKRVAFWRLKMLLLQLCIQASAEGGHHVHHVLLMAIAVRDMIQDAAFYLNSCQNHFHTHLHAIVLYGIPHQYI